MRNITLEDTAKDILKEEFGEKAILIDSELNELSRLVIKRKDVIIALNKGIYTNEKMCIRDSIKRVLILIVLL